MELRRAQPGDLDAIIDGNRRLARETEGVELDVSTLREGVAALLTGAEAGRYWVIEREGEVVAQLMLTYEWSDWRNASVWWIQSVYVWPSARRQGLFRKLFEHVEAAARSEGAAGLRLYVEVENAAAQSTYAALGMDGARYRMFEKLTTDH